MALVQQAVLRMCRLSQSCPTLGRHLSAACAPLATRPSYLSRTAEPAVKARAGTLLLPRAAQSPYQGPARLVSTGRSSLVCRAAESKAGETVATAAPKGSAPAPPPPEEFDLERLLVEDEGVDVEGVVAIDRGDKEATPLARVALLCAGDAAALLIFALIGRLSHGGTADFGVLGTALPFLTGWFLTAPFLGAYGADAASQQPGKAALVAAKAWGAGMPTGLLIRSIFSASLPPAPFIAVSMASTLVLLVGWRAAFATTAIGIEKRKDGNKRGNILEFLQLLGSLTRRW